MNKKSIIYNHIKNIKKARKIGKKRVNVERGQNIKARAKVVEYTNKKGQLNYSFKLYEIL